MGLPLRVDRLQLGRDGRGVLGSLDAAVVVGAKYTGVEGVKSSGRDLVEVIAAFASSWRAAVASFNGGQVLGDDLYGGGVGAGDPDVALGVVWEQVEGHGVGVL